MMAQLADHTGHQPACAGALRALRELQQVQQQQDAVVVAVGLVSRGEEQAIQAGRRQAGKSGIRQAVARIDLQQMQGVVEGCAGRFPQRGLQVLRLVG